MVFFESLLKAGHGEDQWHIHPREHGARPMAPSIVIEEEQIYLRVAVGTLDDSHGEHTTVPGAKGSKVPTLKRTVLIEYRAKGGGPWWSRRTRT